MTRERKQLDSTIEIVTPENIAFRYQVAGPFRRLPAFLIDLAIRVVVCVAIAVAAIFSGLLLSIGGIAGLLFLVSYFLLEWFYGGFFEAYWNGQTPGKRLLGLRVVSANGQPINGLQAVMRNILRVVDLMPLFPLSVIASDIPNVPIVPTFLVGLFSTAFNDRYQRLGDLVCHTMVVVEEKAWLMPTGKIDDPRATQLAEYIPPTFVVSRTLAQALATYVERRPFFSIPRRKDIARHLGEPLVTRFGFPPDTSHDLLLMALYYRTFLQEKPGEGNQPFAPPTAGETSASGAPGEIVFLS